MPGRASRSRFLPPASSSNLLGWELTASNIGLVGVGVNGALLPAYTGAYEVPAGTTISNKLITEGLDLQAGNIVVERCLFKPTDATAGGGWPICHTFDPSMGTPSPNTLPVTIRDCEFDGSLMSVTISEVGQTVAHHGNANMYRNYIHHLGGGFATIHSGATLSVVVENNYVRDMISVGDPATTGNHCDAYTIRDFETAPGRTCVVRNNRFDCSTANATGACFIQANAGPIENVTVQGNYLEGDGWNLALETNNFFYSNVDIINNRFRATGAGRAYYTGGSGYDTWTENYDYHATNPDHKGAVVNEP